ncbi:MAG: ABC transporter permease [Micromonosporaceae bacterium]|jgi:ABC-2 type transport system permease protein|nr:ABC transporter permease [Micromonosporaceae bacterium]
MNPTIAWITARGLFGRRRFLLLFPLPVLVIGLVALGRASGVSNSDWGPAVLVGLGVAVMLPIVALVVGAGVLGSEIEDGTAVHILTKPLPRREIILAKLVVAAAITVVSTAVPMFVAGALTDSVRLGAGLAAGTALGAVTYSALFLLLSLLSRRPVLLGLAYIMIWEGLLTNLLSGTRVLSVQQYTISVADSVAHTSMLTGRVSVPLAVVMAAILTVASTVLAIDRLRSFTLTGETS